MQTAALVEKMPQLHLLGIAVNFACFGGVLPDISNTTRFARLAEEIMGGSDRPEIDDKRFPDFRDFPPVPPSARH